MRTCTGTSSERFKTQYDATYAIFLELFSTVLQANSCAEKNSQRTRYSLSHYEACRLVTCLKLSETFPYWENLYAEQFHEISPEMKINA